VLVQRTIFFTCPVDTADSLVSKYEAGGELAEDIGSALIKVVVYSLGVKQEWVTIENVSSTTELRTASGCGASGGESKARGRREGEGKGEGGKGRRRGGEDGGDNDAGKGKGERRLEDMHPAKGSPSHLRHAGAPMDGAVRLRYTVTLPHPARMPLLPCGMMPLPDASMKLVADELVADASSEAAVSEESGSNIAPVAVSCIIVIIIGGVIHVAAMLLRKEVQPPLEVPTGPPLAPLWSERGNNETNEQHRNGSRVVGESGEAATTITVNNAGSLVNLAMRPPEEAQGHNQAAKGKKKGSGKGNDNKGGTEEAMDSF
jgi:hypothetical protein